MMGLGLVARDKARKKGKCVAGKRVNVWPKKNRIGEIVCESLYGVCVTFLTKAQFQKSH